MKYAMRKMKIWMGKTMRMKNRLRVSDAGEKRKQGIFAVIFLATDAAEAIHLFRLEVRASALFRGRVMFANS
jgi:hypothetical protein